MRDRKPFSLKTLMSVYNGVQVIINLALAVSILHFIFEVKYDLRCQPVNFSENHSGRKELMLVYGYYLVKLFDFLDTVCLITFDIMLDTKRLSHFSSSLFYVKNTIKLHFFMFTIIY